MRTRNAKAGGPVTFTRRMKREGYTILGPDMAPIHFRMLKNVFAEYGYHLELLHGEGRSCIDEGLKYVHNDTCYPALVVIGQAMEALHSGKYDLSRTALIMTQTGGGCRASNYIHLLRKALEKDGLGHIPVISLSTAKLERHSGFRPPLSMYLKGLALLLYGDLMMLLENQVRPYEKRAGDARRVTDRWVERLNGLFEKNRGFTSRARRKIYAEIVADYAAVETVSSRKIRAGIVGEIFVKYSPLANNGLEEFLFREGCETMVPGIVPFFLAAVDHQAEDIGLYGGSRLKKRAVEWLLGLLCRWEEDMLNAVRAAGKFKVPSPYREMKEHARGLIGFGCKMGEGWLLTAEMNELAELGYGNIVCIQPFGCLPNHIVGKGMIRRLKDRYPDSNIVPVDYDPGATRVNQENRIKLMLSVAAEKLREDPEIRPGEEAPVRRNTEGSSPRSKAADREAAAAEVPHGRAL